MHMALPVRLTNVRPGPAGNRWGSGKKIGFQLKNNTTSAGNGGNRGSNRRYRSGETVRQSGIYEVIHDREHREAHEVVMISSERFPDCETCKEKVRFRLIRTAPYIFQDEDFGEEG